MASVNFKNASPLWNRWNIDEKVAALRIDVNIAVKALAVLAQQTVSQIAHSVESAFSAHWNRLTEQFAWTKPHIANDLRTFIKRSGASMHCEIAQCTSVFSNHLRAVKTVSSETAPVSQTGVR